MAVRSQESLTPFPGRLDTSSWDELDLSGLWAFVLNFVASSWRESAFGIEVFVSEAPEIDLRFLLFQEDNQIFQQLLNKSFFIP